MRSTCGWISTKEQRKQGSGNAPFLQYNIDILSVQLFLKMLIILCGIPVAAPGEAVFGKEAVAEIVLVNLVCEVLAAVSVYFTTGRGDIGAAVAVLVIDYIGIVVRVYVNGKSVGVFR